MEERGSAVSSEARQHRILIVSQRHDEPVRAAASTLGQAGGSVTVVPDAYRAMAQLIQPPGFAHLLLDVRDLDEAEMGIVNIASRYCPATVPAVLDLPGIEPRLGRLAPSLRVIDSATLAIRIGDGRASIGPAGQRTEQAEPTSEEGSIEHSLGVDAAGTTAGHGERAASSESANRPAAMEDAADDGISMYEAVRSRMRDGAAAPLRRRPGEALKSPGNPGITGGCDAPVTETGVELTAAEIDALLAIENPPRAWKEESAS